MKGEICRLVTPKRFILNGIFFGSKGAKNVFIYLHGLSGSLFSHINLFEKIVDKNNAVLAFNNRGSGVINKVRQLPSSGKKISKAFLMGTAHEVFTDCIDDIEGAIKTAKSFGAKNIFLMGHSTGCQKSVYYLAKRKKSSVKGAVLLAPISDYADAIVNHGEHLLKARRVAEKMVKEGSGHELMPSDIWPLTHDAQRFLSLFTPESAEEIFTYASGKKPRTLQVVNKPLLAVFAGGDEFTDRPAEEIAAWFEKTLFRKKHQIEIVKGSPHHFSGHEVEVSKLIREWINEYYK